ncbi:MAG: P-type conjugative transfer protein TrbL [Candidatus Thiodiazotropha endolucinida]
MKIFNKTPIVALFVASLACFLLVATDANAAINNDGIMDEVLDRFESNAGSWANTIESAATRLFWTLALISMVWTFGMMALRKADIGEFFAEFVRFTIFTGFFWWLLINGPAFTRSIINSLRQLGGSAAGLGGYSGQFTPSDIVDTGFIMLGKTLVESSVWSPVDSALGIVLGLIVLGLTAMIAVNILLLYVSAWILAYGGIFFLGFGGSRWTSDMAINYFKAVLGIAIQIMTMILIIGIGVSLINDYYTNMQTELDLTEMAVVTVVAFTIMLLSNKVPQLLSGIITVHMPGGMGIGQFGAGAMLGAAGTATAAATMTGSMVASGAAEVTGGLSALKAAFSQANANSTSSVGGEILTATSAFDVSSAEDGFSGGSGPSGGGFEESPFAKAAGLSNHTSRGSTFSNNDLWNRSSAKEQGFPSSDP